jgi:hypothetical protein
MCLNRADVAQFSTNGSPFFCRLSREDREVLLTRTILRLPEQQRKTDDRGRRALPWFRIHPSATIARAAMSLILVTVIGQFVQD